MKKFLSTPLINIIALCGLLGSALMWHSSAYAAANIHFSKYRFVFDDTLRQDSLILSNAGINAATCTMSSENFIMTEQGPTKLATKEDKDKITNSAEKIIRFSPRRVTINPSNRQTVRIASRRKPNIDDGEFLSYLKISCQEQANPNQPQASQIAVNANFVYYIPIQVRVGKLTASTRIENAKITEANGVYALSFDQFREGSRSVVGKIDITEKKSGNSLGVVNNTVIYTPFTKKQYKINLKSAPDGPVEITFNEEQITRGTLTAKAEVQR